MSISASMVKELRERTGAGMMECKKALVEAGGDMDLAAENLRKSGQAKADKKAGRVAADPQLSADRQFAIHAAWLPPRQLDSMRDRLDISRVDPLVLQGCG